jgi:hypothetical protein
MLFSAKPEDRAIAPQACAPQRRLDDLVVAYAASLVINAAFLFLMIFGIVVSDEPPPVQEAQVEIIIEAPPPPIVTPEVKQEPPPASHPPPPPETLKERESAHAKEKLSDRSLREISDEDREQMAPEGEKTVAGAGKDKVLSGAPQEPGEKRDSEDTEPDPKKEISHLVPPATTAAPHPKTKIAPPGPTKELEAKRKKTDKPATQNETTMKEKKITCGANAKSVLPSPQQPRRGQVLGVLTRAQAAQMIRMTQANADMLISPNYVNNVRVFVHVDGTREGAWGVVLLPAGLSVQAGDRVKFLPAHLDPSTPCHYIPNIALRIL